MIQLHDSTLKFTIRNIRIQDSHTIQVRYLTLVK